MRKEKLQNLSAINNAGIRVIPNLVIGDSNKYLSGDILDANAVADVIEGIQQFHFEIYANIEDITEPAGNVLYLIGPVETGTDKYEEYVYVDNEFVKIGDTTTDLSNYVTTQALNTALATKQDIIDDIVAIRSGAAKGATAYQKPGTGIAENDLNIAVKTILEHADSTYSDIYETYFNNGELYSNSILTGHIQRELIDSNTKTQKIIPVYNLYSNDNPVYECEITFTSDEDVYDYETYFLITVDDYIYGGQTQCKDLSICEANAMYNETRLIVRF